MKADPRRIFHGTLLAVLAVVTVAGLWALGDRSFQGLRVANFTSISPWGLWLSLYIYFIGLSAGSFLISSLVFVFGVKRFEPVGRLALVQALGCLIVGLLLILVDLGRPERAYRVITNWNGSSVLAWEILFYTAYIVVLALEIWILIRPDLMVKAGRARWWWSRAAYRFLAAPPPTGEIPRPTPKSSLALRSLALAGIPLAIGVHGGTGMIFAVVKARPYWYTGLFPILFIISALVSGGALLTFLTAFFIRGTDSGKLPLVKGLARLTAYILLVDLLMLGIESFIALYGDVPDHSEPYRMILTGPFWWVFWFVQVLGGSVIPLFLILGPTKNRITWLGIAAGMVVVGIVGVRLNIVIPPLQTSWAGGLPAEFHHNLSGGLGYVPSLNEWLSSFGAIALGVWGFLLFRKVIPLEPMEGEPKA